MSTERGATGPRLWGRFVLLAGLVLAADQGLKALVLAHLQMGQSVPVLGGLMSLTRAANRGALFGMFSSAGVVLVVVSALLVVLLVAWSLISARHHPELMVPLGLIVGGALGNMADRIAYGMVVDYLDFHFWPVFNLADIALTVGVGLTALRLLRPPQPPGPRVEASD